ncbi:Uncharacterized protein FWK35_00009601, partial [Aphis craccivora]
MNALIFHCCVCVCVFFFVSVYTRTYRNNASISNFGGGFRWKNKSYWCIGEFSKASAKIKKKLRKNGNFYAKPVFDHIDFFIIWFVDKNILDDQKFKFFTKSVKNAKICKIKNTTLNDNDLRFKYFISRRYLKSKYLKIDYKAQFFLLAFELRVENSIRDSP